MRGPGNSLHNGLLNGSRWSVGDIDDACVSRLSVNLGVSRLVARVLAARGITDEREAEIFLHPDPDRDLHSPQSIPGIIQVRDALKAALLQSKRILVFGDFDVDGMTSTAIMTMALRHFGAQVIPLVPHRFHEGYGLSKEAIERARMLGDFDCIVTVDNGISSAHEVKWLLDEGYEVLITDHHEPGDLVPQGVAVADPKLSRLCPSRDLCGAGLALKIVQLLGEELGEADLWKDFLDLAALGTVADLMYLGRENRAIVDGGIRCMREHPRVGLLALSQLAGADLSQITADKLPWTLIPRMNAAGRMGEEDTALQLLLAEDTETSQLLAGRLEQLNTARKETEALLTEAAIKQAEATYRGGSVLVVGDEGWHEGVKGIVAAKLVSRFQVPAIVFSFEDGIAKGSGRSTASLDLFSAIESCGDLLIRYGGHPGAIGVTCRLDVVDELRRRLEAYIAALPKDSVAEGEKCCIVADPAEVDVASIMELDRLQPFGQGNPQPIFMLQNMTLSRMSRVGARGAHLRFSAVSGKKNLQAIWFNCPDPEGMMADTAPRDIVCELVAETWRGITRPKLMVKDVCGSVEPFDPDEVPCLYGDTTLDASHVPAQDRESEAGTDAQCAASVAGQQAAERLQLASFDYRDVTEELCRRFTGCGSEGLFPAQALALKLLEEGRSVLAVLPTGRGKSLIFQIHAARQALFYGKASILVYPLRALVNDQACHMQELFADLGVASAVLSGETPRETRKLTFSDLTAHRLDVVLTTPEFLSVHERSFVACGRFDFLAVDEAHHIAGEGGGDRPAYRRLPGIMEALGIQNVLALSATMTSQSARLVCELFSIDETCLIKDPFTRNNLHIVDYRGCSDKSAQCAHLVADGEKSIVYVSSRTEAARLTSALRHRLPDLAPRIAFYHAGLSREKRGRVERAFRDDELSSIVSTSAFGEGVNIGSVRRVILFSLPFSEISFNQMSGRAGRDHQKAEVSLLFGPKDVPQVQKILRSAAPEKEDLVALYRTLMTIAPPGTPIFADSGALTDAVRRLFKGRLLSPDAVDSGLGIFEELGFCTCSGFGDDRRVVMASHPRHRRLTESESYGEGLAAAAAFDDFAEYVCCTDADVLQSQIRCSIMPDFGILVD